MIGGRLGIASKPAVLALGRVAGRVRGAAGVARAQWRDFGRLDRVQAVLAGALAVGVFSVFALGAATRGQGAGDARPAGVAATAKRPSKVTAPPSKGGPEKPGSPSVRADARSGTSPRSGAAAAPAEQEEQTAAKRNKRKKAKRKPPAPSGASAGGEAPVVVGVTYRTASAGAALSEALGLDASPTDSAAQAGAVANWLNAHGGISGRRVELRLAAHDPALSGSYADAFGAACSAVSSGTVRPVAVVGALEEAAVQTACLGAKGIPLIGDAPAPGDRQTFAEAGDHLISPGSMSLDRLAAGYSRALERAGFFATGARVGVLRLQGAPFARADAAALRPALEAAGAKVVAEQVMPRPRTAGEAPSALSRALEAALAFQGARVDRVVVLDDGIAAPLFMRAADGIGYRPRYGLNSSMVPAALPAQVPARQLAGAVGAGFAPLLDVSAADEPEAPQTRRRCEEIFRDAGVAVGSRTGAGQFAAIGLCDGLLALRDALEDTGGGGLARAFERFTDRRPSAVALSSRLDQGRHDGAAELRPLAYDGGCGCVRYSGAGEAIR